MSELIGLNGASLAGYAHLPQITHLIRQQCSAGISRRADEDRADGAKLDYAEHNEHHRRQ
jgi:hypothetical protein